GRRDSRPPQPTCRPRRRSGRERALGSRRGRWRRGIERRGLEEAEGPREPVLRLVELAEHARVVLSRPRLVLLGEDVLEHHADLELLPGPREPQRFLGGGEGVLGRLQLLLL